MNCVCRRKTNENEDAPVEKKEIHESRGHLRPADRDFDSNRISKKNRFDVPTYESAGFDASLSFAITNKFFKLNE